MMTFRTIKKALITTVDAEAAGNFTVIGHERQKKSAAAINKIRHVQIYYTLGQFRSTGGTLRGPKSHDMSFNIDLTVSASAKVDLATLENSASTPEQKAVALAGVQEATNEADDLLDELIDLVYQILMDSRNMNLGLAKGTFSNRWITDIKKDTTIDEGGFAVKTAQLIYTCNAKEDVPGETGTTPATPTYDTTIDIDGDDTEKTGVTVINT